MPAIASNSEYSIGRLTGDASIRKLALTGWGNALATKSSNGMMWFKVTTGNNLEVYSAPEMVSANLMCLGAISSGAVTLVQYSGSGISGSALVTHTSGTESTGRILVSFADEPELEDVLQSTSGFLTTNQWRGEARFERAFKIAKRELDTWIVESNIGKHIPLNADGTYNLSVIANPQCLKDVHSRLTAAVILERKGTLDTEELARANYLRDRAKEYFRQAHIELDYSSTGIVEARRPGSQLSVYRT